MRARNIKPGFFKNDAIGEMSFQSRLLFIGLWCMADREGRLEDKPKKIWAELFPYDRDLDVNDLLIELERGGFILRYEIKGVKLLYVVNFVKHQDPHYKEKASELPPPPGKENKIKAVGVTRSQRLRILERDNYQCRDCGSKKHLSIDHIIPVSRGGNSDDDNLQVLCMSCNTTKGNKLKGEDKQTRPNESGRKQEFGLTSIQGQIELGLNNARNEPLIVDSLIPDLLTPDTLIMPPAQKTMVVSVSLPDGINADLWSEFVDNRKRLKEPLSQNAAKLIINKLEKLKAQGHCPNLILQESIMNNWKGVFPLKAGGSGVSKEEARNQKYREFADELRSGF